MRIAPVLKYIPQQGVLCDLGCGTEAQFLQSVPGTFSKKIGIDMKLHKIHVPGLVLVKQELIKTIKLPSESVDCMTMLALLEHLDHPQEILNECHRVLKQNGRLILTTPSPWSRPFLWFFALTHLSTPEEVWEHRAYFSKRKLQYMLEHAGFSVEVMKRFQFGLNKFAVCRKK